MLSSSLSSASTRLVSIAATILAALALTSCASTASLSGRPEATAANAKTIDAQLRAEVCSSFAYILPSRDVDSKETIDQVDLYNTILYRVYQCPLPGTLEATNRVTQ